jgi:hypothetical protein
VIKWSYNSAEQWVFNIQVDEEGLCIWEIAMFLCRNLVMVLSMVQVLDGATFPHLRLFYLRSVFVGYCFFFLSFDNVGVWTQGFVLAKQALCCLSHHFSCIWRWGLMNYLFGLALKFDLPHLSLPSSEDYRHETPVCWMLLKLPYFSLFWQLKHNYIYYISMQYCICSDRYCVLNAHRDRLLSSDWVIFIMSIPAVFIKEFL